MTIHSDAPLNAGQIQQITQTTQAYISKANTSLGLQLKTLAIHFNVFGTAWGYYVKHGKQRYFRFNPFLFSKHMEEGLHRTVPHEVAHYVVDSLYSRRCKPHGAEWKSVMQLLGITNPRATHTTDLSGLKIRRQRKFVYRCACMEHQLSATRHNRIQRQQAIYHCKLCQQPLVLNNHGIDEYNEAISDQPSRQ